MHVKFATDFKQFINDAIQNPSAKDTYILTYVCVAIAKLKIISLRAALMLLYTYVFG